jgi:hypothetical protein
MPCPDATKTFHRCAPCPCRRSSSTISCTMSQQHCQPSSTSKPRLHQGQWGLNGRSSTTLSCTRGTSSCQRPLPCGHRSYSNHMAWAMKVFRRHCTGSTPRSSCHTTVASSATSFEGALFVSATRQNTCTRLGSSNLSTSPLWSGRTLPWTSSRGS